jgi:hypothetical protein
MVSYMPSITTQISRLLKTNLVMTISELSDALNHRARSSLFRDLQNIPTLSSYTHAGKYHALKATLKFNSTGLWLYQNIGFSKYGTLKDTIVNLIESSNAGQTHKELAHLLKIKTHNTLKPLVEDGKITRQQMPNNLYVYLHGDNKKSKQQLECRSSINVHSLAEMSTPSLAVTIIVLAELIRHNDIETDPVIITKLVKQSGLDITIESVEAIFSHYQIKKKPI